MLDRHILHVITGSRFSGITYLLAGIYAKIRDRAVYYFDGRAKISNSAFEELLAKNNSLILLETGSISRHQMDMMLDKLAEIQANHIDIVIVANRNDLFGLIRIGLRDGRISQEQYKVYPAVQSSMDRTEKDKANKAFAAIGIPVYQSSKYSFLDHLTNVQSELGMRGKYDDIHIYPKDTRELALFIALATKKVLYYREIVELDFEGYIGRVISEYSPFIDEEKPFLYERDASDLSSVKYVLNSSFWLRKELGEYYKNNGSEKIKEAYYYIIERLLYDIRTIYDVRDKYRKYTEFENINDIFMTTHGGTLSLAPQIYDYLQPLLGNEYHFMHQKAKCFYRVAIGKKEKQRENIDIALQAIVSAKALIAHDLETSTSNPLQITYDHILFTQASILCEKISIEEYKNLDLVEQAFSISYEAILLPNNNAGTFERDGELSRSIKKAITEIMTRDQVNNLSPDTKEKIIAIFEGFMNGRHRGKK